MDQPQMTVASALDDCTVCMQKRKRIDTEFCSSRAAEEASRKVCGYDRVY